MPDTRPLSAYRCEEPSVPLGPSATLRIDRLGTPRKERSAGSSLVIARRPTAEEAIPSAGRDCRAVARDCCLRSSALRRGWPTTPGGGRGVVAAFGAGGRVAWRQR